MANEKQLIDANDFYDTVIFTDADVFEMDANEYYTSGLTRETIKRLLDEAPTVDAVEVVHAEWIEAREIPSYSNKNIPVVECSKCRCFFCDIINVHSFMYHYCPNCGAKMDGGNDDG